MSGNASSGKTHNMRSSGDILFPWNNLSSPFHKRQNIGMSFLIVTGSDTNIFVANRRELKLPVLQTFRAAYETQIYVYGSKSITANLGLRINFTHSFYICNVSCPIMGAFFLHTFFSAPDLSLFESLRKQFGLCNGSSTFQRLIDEFTRDLPFVYAFVDDLLVASQNETEHLNIKHLSLLFSKLLEYGLCINVEKC
ncbi:transposon Ty3-I Gag-Pol polyprotein [Nephila pilipes]|uniref:Transposon Ty3-I Gag-Pol polyprotein n=1 Tax=Nephila pilipes TaxID=299642 RepID=A0A8X6IVM8_NEPPI|nr:transposon Ty3-I Gag-Pol polyprotein [Nephila pilipes]